MTQDHSRDAESSPQAPRSGYGFLSAILDSLDDGELLAALETHRTYRDAGRRGYGVRALWRVWLTKYLLQIPYNVELIQRLEGSARLREICGLTEVPSGPTLSRFFKRVTEFQALVDKVLVSITDRIKEHLPGLGKILAVDSTVFETYGNPGRKTKKGDPCGDMDAAWGYKNSVRTKDKEKIEWCFGYRLHTIADAVYGIPLGFVMTPANENDNPMLPKVFKKAKKSHKWLRPKVLVGDKGYDGEPNHLFLLKRKVTAVINLKKPSNGKLHLGIYSKNGSPTCIGMTAMDYIGTDRNTGHHLFRCPKDGCPLKGSSKLQHHCAYEDWEDPAKQPRIVGKLHRASVPWKHYYKLRWTIERLFGSVKRSRLLTDHCFRGWKKNIMHATLSMLTYSATVLAHLQAGNKKQMRLMRVRVA